MIRVLFLLLIGLSVFSPKAFGFGDQAKVAIAQLVLDNGGPQREIGRAHV